MTLWAMASVDELWLVDFGRPYLGEPASFRPALVLGPPDTFGPVFPFVIVAPVTTTRRGLSLHVELDPTPSNGLADDSHRVAVGQPDGDGPSVDRLGDGWKLGCAILASYIMASVGLVPLSWRL